MEQYRLLEQNESKINDFFWSRYISLVKEEVIPYQWDILNDKREDSEPSHAIDNFRIAAGDMDGEFYGQVFQDSDVSKWLEAVGNILMLDRDEQLEEKADSVIGIIERAQQPDGYLDTYFIIEEPDKKWTNVLECHELYCAGHFIEGAISYYLATGKKKVYQIALRLADHIDTVFGPEDGKLHGYPGHQEIEIALLRLYDVSKNEKYLKLVQYFIDTRGTNDFFEQEFEKREHICFWTKEKVEEPNRWYNQFPSSYYNQFHLPVREQTEAVGHAVRAVYMYTAMADLASRTQDESLFEASRTLWNNIVNKQLYITGGIGATPSGEAFTVDYDLPNATNYSETCASIGLIFFAQKMMKMEIDSIYGDVIEQALYNTVLGGMNYDGNRFFYVNPLEVVPETCLGNTERNHVKPVRQKWFACACCPPNIARLIGGLWQYIYTAGDHAAFVHLYIGGEARIDMPQGKLSIVQTTNYPWDEKIVLDVKADTEEPMTVALRIPKWSGDYTLYADGEAVVAEKNKNGYLYVTRNWSVQVQLVLRFSMRPQLMQSNSNVHYNANRVAIVRGPLVYCMEEVDNGRYLNRVSIDSKEPFAERKDKTLWNGCVLLDAKGYRVQGGASEELYAPYAADEEEVRITAIPYFLWNNRKPGEMQVWIHVK